MRSSLKSEKVLPKTDKDQLLKIIDGFTQPKIVVVGDLMLDRYLWCAVDRISPEAPVPIARVEKETVTLGGAANTIYNLCSLNVKVEVVGLIGDDPPGRQVLKILADQEVGLQGLIIDPGRPTTVKTRIMSGNHQMIRFDNEVTRDIDDMHRKKLMISMSNILDGAKTLVISDYSKGLISNILATQIISMAKKRNIKALVDPTPQSFLKYKHSYLVKPNKKEAEAIVNQKMADDYSDLHQFGQKIIKKLNTEIAFITLGKDGIAVIDSHHGVFRIPTAAREVYDVSGAGDTVMAALAASLSCGASIKQAAVIANVCGGVVVGKLGTATCTREELITYINQMP